MKTKYIAVPVSERLPEPNNDVIIISEFNDIGQGYITESNNWALYGFSIEGDIDFWLEEVPDHSEEMLSVLSEVMRFKHELRMIMSDKLQYPDNFLKALNDAEQLINKINNGKI